MHVLPVGGCDKEAVGDNIGGFTVPIKYKMVVS